MTQLLTADARAQLDRLRDEVGAGDELTLARWQAMHEDELYFEHAIGVEPEDPTHAYEPFRLIRETQDSDPIIGPRWWFHVLGLRHGSVHVIVTTPQGLFVCQRRSRGKDDAPGAMDLAVTGHCGTLDPMPAAWKELSEEIGVWRDDANPMIENNHLRFIGTNEHMGISLESAPIPLIDRERTWIFEAHLTPHGMATMHFADGEVTALMLMGNHELAEVHQRIANGSVATHGELNLAWGIRRTLPIWLAQR